MVVGRIRRLRALGIGQPIISRRVIWKAGAGIRLKVRRSKKGIAAVNGDWAIITSCGGREDWGTLRYELEFASKR